MGNTDIRMGLNGDGGAVIHLKHASNTLVQDVHVNGEAVRDLQRPLIDYDPLRTERPLIIQDIFFMTVGVASKDGVILLYTPPRRGWRGLWGRFWRAVARFALRRL